jgi:hypothetical protein
MALRPKSTIFAGEHILDVTADSDAQADGLEKLKELARNASPENRTRIQRTIAAVAQPVKSDP